MNKTSIINEVGTFVNQSIGYNILETVVVVLVIAFFVWLVKIALED